MFASLGLSSQYVNAEPLRNANSYYSIIQSFTQASSFSVALHEVLSKTAVPLMPKNNKLSLPLKAKPEFQAISNRFAHTCEA